MRHLDDPVRDGVEKAAVVRDDERRESGARLPLHEPALEELDSDDVEMVRGLVEKEDRGVRQKQPGDLGAVLLPARKLAHGPVPERSRKTDAHEHPVHARVGLVAARALEMLAHVVVLGQEHVERGAVAAGAVRGDGLLEAPHLALEREQGLLGARDERPERLVALRLDRLVERGERRSARDVAACRRRAPRAPARSSGRSTSPPRSARRGPRSGPGRAATWRPEGRPSSRSSCGRFRADTAPRGG